MPAGEPNTRRRQTVIGDVAKLACVSVPTVSRVLTGSAPVSETKRRRVFAAIEELGYRPNAAAQVLAGRDSSLIAVFASNTGRYGNAMTLQGIVEAATEAEFTTSITVLESADPDKVDATLRLPLSHPVAGVLIVDFDDVGATMLSALQPGVPAVSLGGEPRTGIPQVSLREHEAAFRLTAMLLDLGHETVVHVSIPSGRDGSVRTAGWRDALLHHGAPVPPVRQAGWSPACGRELGREIASDPGVTAIFCGNDQIAAGVVAGAREVGRAVPDDLSVAGFDDQPLAEFVAPSLTTVRQDFVALGHSAVDTLRAMLAGEQVPGSRLCDGATLVVRDSTGPPPGAHHYEAGS